MKSYLARTILPDERILYCTKKHYIIFLQPIIWTLATIAILVYPQQYIWVVAILFAFISVISWLNEWLQFAVSEYVVTTKRVLMREGFFLKHINDTRLSTIANVQVMQGVLGQLLNFGTIVIKSYGGMDDPFVEIANPNEFKIALEMQLNKLQELAGRDMG